jgi:hypothetical protein
MVTAEWEQALRSAWAELSLHSPRARRFRTRRLSADLCLDAHAGLRATDDAPCLVIEAAAPADACFEVSGMRLYTAEGDEGPLLVLSLEDSAGIDLFATVCADALQSSAGVPPVEVLTSFLARLHAWRYFLRERRSGLTRNETVGLMGELVVLRRLIQDDATLLANWTAPDDGLHDFELTGHALEIKSTLGSAATLHISSLDQLDTSGLRRLDLLHVRLVETPTGECLEDMIQVIFSCLVQEVARRDLANALLRRGLMPDDTGARDSPRVSVQALTAFAVEKNFPRLIRASVPPAIAEVGYMLELRGIEAYSVEADIVLAAFAGRTIF